MHFFNFLVLSPSTILSKIITNWLNPTYSSCCMHEVIFSLFPYRLIILLFPLDLSQISSYGLLQLNFLLSVSCWDQLMEWNRGRLEGGGDIFKELILACFLSGHACAGAASSLVKPQFLLSVFYAFSFSPLHAFSLSLNHDSVIGHLLFLPLLLWWSHPFSVL